MDTVTKQNLKTKALACKALDELKALRDQVRSNRGTLNQLVQLDAGFKFAIDDSFSLESKLVGEIVRLNQHIQQTFKSNCPKTHVKPETRVVFVRAVDDVPTTGLKFQQPSRLDESAKKLPLEGDTVDTGFPNWDDTKLPMTFMTVSEKYPTTYKDCGCSYYGESLLLACLEHATF